MEGAELDPSSEPRATRRRSLSAIERLLFLRADERTVVERLQAMVRVAAADAWCAGVLLRQAIDVPADDWLHVFVAGGYAPSLRLADAFMTNSPGRTTAMTDRPQRDLLVQMASITTPSEYRREKSRLRLLNGPGLAIKLRGNKSVRGRLAAQYHDQYGKAASSSALADAMATIEGMALRQPPTELHLRVAQAGDALWLDLGRGDGDTFVEIAQPDGSCERNRRSPSEGPDLQRRCRSRPTRRGISTNTSPSSSTPISRRFDC